MNKSSEKFAISELRYTDSFRINMHEFITISSILKSRKDASPGYVSETSQWVLQLDELVVDGLKNFAKCRKFDVDPA